MANKTILQCYNRGCGQTYELDKNADDVCRHHPGLPFFHDAYKGWSCCNKKCTDFTEFLNIKGCTVSKHSNEKPPEPEKPPTKDVPTTEVVEVKPIIASSLERPPYDTPMITLKAEVAPSLKQQFENSSNKPTQSTINNDLLEIPIGTMCKNSGCKTSYEGPQTNDDVCAYHPGVPIFHEGLKFWSCCQKRTSDFNAFLSQVGCEQGKHVWKKEETDSQVVQCRWDYHQTASYVILSIYAKNYSPTESVIQINPIRLFVKLVFPEQSDALFTLDVELKGVIDVKGSQASMYGTKVEIKLKKAEPGSWTRLEVPRVTHETELRKPKLPDKVDSLTPKIDSVDLSDL